MNWKNAKQNISKIVKIRPMVRNSAWRDGDWLVREIDPLAKLMRIEYLPSGHVATLGGDAVHCWDENQGVPNGGFLRVKQQLSFRGCNIDYEPLPKRFWA